ncbi:MAG: FeoB-associated Cys-rich membrane protein [Clostridia bacterium]|nr:FeoB-associated Cys-rich membrane protein [Clostridia bacterium]
MSTLDWLLIAAVIIGLFFAVRYMIRHRGSCSCGGGCCHDCASCHNVCAHKHSENNK